MPSAPDLDIIDASLADNTLEAGDQIEASWAVHNIGDAAIGAGNVSILIFDVSANDYIRNSDGSPRVFANNSIDSLSAGATDTNESRSFTLPTDLAAGNYQLVLAATPPSGETEADYTNNTERLSFTVEDNSAPDLDIIDASLADNTLEAGDQIQASWAVHNIGDAAIGAGNVSILIFDVSANDYIRNSDGSPRVFANNSIDSLSAGATDTNESRSFILPTDLAAGNYQLVLAATPPSGETEADYTNNTERLSFTVTSAPQTFFIPNSDTDPNDSDQDIDALIGPQGWQLTADRSISFGFITNVSELTDLNKNALTAYGSETFVKEDGNEVSFTYGSTFAFESMLTNEQMSGARAAISILSNYIDVNFVEQTDLTVEPVIRFMNVEEDRGFGYNPNENSTSGDIGFGTDNREGLIPGTHAYHTYLHELGHAMGLKHGHTSNVNVGLTGTLTPEHNSQEYSIMTYSGFIGDFPDDYNGMNSPDGNFHGIIGGNHAQTMMMYDIAALQRIYGADYTTEAQNSVYTFDQNSGEMKINSVSQGLPYSNIIFRTIWDGNGEDTYDLSNFTSDLRLNLVAGEFSDFDVGGNDQRARLDSSLDEYASGHVYNALQYNGDIRSLIENAIGGSGDDIIIGNTGSNQLTGGAGRDRLYDGLGDDTVYGGDNNDYIRVGGGEDHFHGGAGKDYISYYDSKGGVNINLSTNEVSGSWAVNDTISGFESVSGSKKGDDVIYGTSGSNTIKTYGGNDRVYAGSGADVVDLGSGNDYVRVGGGVEMFDGGSGKDYISYYDSADGIRIDLEADTVSWSWAYNDTIKNFESASGSKTGADKMLGTSGSNTLKSYGGDDRLYGRGGDDKLYGGDGDDRFDGGAGTDLLYGGAGADTFHFDHGEDHDIIKDFENNIDVIQLDNFTFSGGQDAFDFATQIGSDVVFDFGGGDTLTVENATIAQLVNDVVMV